MTAKRTPIRRDSRRRINDAAIAAWKACDHSALCRALGLTGRSPLPKELTALGIDEDEIKTDREWDKDFDDVLALQRELFAVAGPPDTDAMRRIHLQYIADAEFMVAWYRRCIADPKSAPLSASNNWKQSLKDKLDEIAWRIELLDAL